MQLKYLLAVDLEGAHGVVGEPYKGLSVNLPDYTKAVENITKEVNAAISALFDCGADEVIVWDNHGNRDNLDFTKIDGRAKKIKPESNGIKRLSFLFDGSYSAMLMIGYHAREGLLGGVLAHTYSSADIQYYKLGDKAVGETDIDEIIAASYGVPTVFLSSDNVCVNEFSSSRPNIATAVTKIGKGRNRAEFLPPEKVLSDIYNGVKRAAQKPVRVRNYPFPCIIEVRFTRSERAAEICEKLRAENFAVQYGEDSHILTAVVNNADELRLFL